MTDRHAEIQRRLTLLTQNFQQYVCAFDEEPAFTKSDQLQNHVATIKRRRQHASSRAALSDAVFLNLLHATLNSWGIGQRGSKLVPLEEFARAIGSCAPLIEDLEGLSIEDPGLKADVAADKLWTLIETLHIVQNSSRMVPCTKALHHLLPDLVVPMDRKFTRTFFGWHVPEFQYQQRRVFEHGFQHFASIAAVARPSQFADGNGWRTSPAKIIDNAIVAFCRVEDLPTPS